MAVHKRKKNSRQRGSHTHGWGSKKKHRGAGNKGGKGMAGTGKRADAKKPSIWKNKKYFGKFGFKSKSRENIKAVNLSYFEEHLNRLVTDKKVEQENDMYIIDISKLGYNKLLGNGKITKKYKFIAGYASQNAIDKVKRGGGNIILKDQVNPDKLKEGQ